LAGKAGIGEPYERREMALAVNRLTNYKTFAHFVKIYTKERPAVLQEAERYENLAHARAIDLYQKSLRDILPALRYVTSKRAQRVAICLVACEYIAQNMASEPFFTEVGAALEYYQDEGMLLADVHTANIGTAEREDGKIVVIRDPGHAVPLTEAARNIRVPVLT
jgi:hypothetical protein